MTFTQFFYSLFNFIFVKVKHRHCIIFACMAMISPRLNKNLYHRKIIDWKNLIYNVNERFLKQLELFFTTITSLFTIGCKICDQIFISFLFLVLKVSSLLEYFICTVKWYYFRDEKNFVPILTFTQFFIRFLILFLWRWNIVTV